MKPASEARFTESVTRSPEETFELGRAIGERLTSGAVFLLKGNLGTGKTVFTKGLAAGLGIDPADVTSPSFTLINEHVGRLKLVHIDLYRLGVGPLPELGLEEIFADSEAVVVVEWAERIPVLPKGAVEVEFSYVSDSERRIVVSDPKS
jgi:tRNA threonylcarbamoyladenosine biosynthesis protein TsaE